MCWSGAVMLVATADDRSVRQPLRPTLSGLGDARSGSLYRSVWIVAIWMMTP
jgi:hypothetical protein